MSENMVKRRWVLYFSGFDPAGPGKYHQLFKQQSATAAPLLNARIDIGDRSNNNADKLSTWQITNTSTTSSSTTTQTDFAFARWDDLIRQHWLPLNKFTQMASFLKPFLITHWLYWRSGAMLRMLRISRPPALALIMPLILVFGVLLLATMIFALASWAGLESLIYKENRALAPTEYARKAIFLIATTGIWIAAMWRIEKRWHMFWLMRSFIFTRLQALGRLPDLDKRLDMFADHIRSAAVSGKYDEILIVGHSSGSMMASLALSHALPLQSSLKIQISLLTLGHWWPLLSCLPSADAARKSLAHLANQEFKWVDVSAAADGCCFAFIDPTPEASLTRPQCVSARWHTLFTAQEYTALKRDRFRLHFQYIHATPELGDCDFFAITSGAQTLSDRFASIPSVSAKSAQK